MSQYIPNVGDVVLYNGKKNVVISMKSYEDMGSCCYDRKYLLCEEDYIKNNQGDITLLELEKHGVWFVFRGLFISDIEKIDNIAPYNVNQIETYNIKQKTVKNINVYE